MNDQHLADFIADVRTHLINRHTQTGAKFELNEAQWLLECVNTCRARIVMLESEAADKLQSRDKIALQLLPGLLEGGTVGCGEMMGRAFELADLFLEARKEPAIKTVVPNPKYQWRRVGETDWLECTPGLHPTYRQTVGFETRIVSSPEQGVRP